MTYEKLETLSRIYNTLLLINTKDCLTSKNSNYQNKINSLNMKDLVDNQYIRLSPKLKFEEHEEVKVIKEKGYKHYYYHMQLIYNILKAQQPVLLLPHHALAQ